MCAPFRGASNERPRYESKLLRMLTVLTRCSQWKRERDSAKVSPSGKSLSHRRSRRANKSPASSNAEKDWLIFITCWNHWAALLYLRSKMRLTTL
eukprot:4819021-Pleurochrysis_carterae.AAC.2